MSKELDLNKSIYELTQEYPELIEIMAGLGFTEITKKAMLNSVGKLTTIPKGAKMKNISMMYVVTTLMSNGFQLVGEMPTIAVGGSLSSEKSSSNQNISSEAEVKFNTEQHDTESDEQKSRTEQLKSYLRRLGEGEELESVRADFVKNFKDVDAAEIMKAEQELMRAGTPIEEVQKLCDVHSALFHGATREEKIANAEIAVQESLRQQNEITKSESESVGATEESKPASTEAELRERAATRTAARQQAADNLVAIKAHPLYTFTKENEALEQLLHNFRKERTDKLFDQIRDVSIHYAKKGDLLYPHLKAKYEIAGPSDIMWTVDDEIRDELAALAKIKDRDAEWNRRLDAVLTRVDEMIYKEANILFPICAETFNEEEWYGIYRDSKDYADSFGVENEVWEEAEAVIEANGPNNVSTAYPVGRPAGEDAAAQTGAQGKYEGEIVMPGGHMNVEQLTALLNTLPLEITFIDADNINRFFNEGPKDFKRPGMAIDREVFSCHPPKIEPLVRSIIDDFRAGTRDMVPVWMEKNGKTVLVRYLAVRDRNGKYLGTMEAVENMNHAKEHFAKGE